MGKTNNWDRLIASAPVNRQAAVTAYGQGSGYVPQKKIVHPEWDAPPPMRRVPRDIVDLTGHRQGRLLVIGLYISTPDHGQGTVKWVCRCDCSRYVLRRRKALLNPANAQDRCELCRHAAFLAREATSERTEQRKRLGKPRQAPKSG